MGERKAPNGKNAQNPNSREENQRAGEKVRTAVWPWWWLGSRVSMFHFIASSSGILDRGTCPGTSVLGYFDPLLQASLFH